MLIRTRRGWELPESAASNEAVFHDRRRLLQGLAAGPILAATGLGNRAAWAADADPSAALYPAKRNERYVLDRPVTDEKYPTTYNNFYEFGADKSVWREAQALKVRPWTIKIDGMVEQPMTLDIDDLLKKVSLEERLYRHRCVEAWSFTVPWTGFPMKALLEPDVERLGRVRRQHVHGPRKRAPVRLSTAKGRHPRAWPGDPRLHGTDARAEPRHDDVRYRRFASGLRFRARAD